MFKTKSLVSEIIRLVILLFSVSLLAFILITSAPIDPLTTYVGTESTLSPEARQEIAQYWGLNDPLPQRFFTWLGHLFQGDMGTSITYKRPVADVIFESAVNETEIRAAVYIHYPPAAVPYGAGLRLKACAVNAR